MLWAMLNKSWKQHPTNQQLYVHLLPITKTIKVRRSRHAGHFCRSKEELICRVLLQTPSNGRAKAGRPARTYIRLLRVVQDVSLKTSRKQLTIEKGAKKGSVISMLMVWDDDDDDIFNCQWQACGVENLGKRGSKTLWVDRIHRLHLCRGVRLSQGVPMIWQ